MAVFRILGTPPFLRRATVTSQSSPLFPTTGLRLLSTNPSARNQLDYRKQISLANILQRYGFPTSQLQNFLSRNRFLLNWNSVDVEKSLCILLSSFKIPQSSLVSLLSDCPGVLDLQFLKKWQFNFSDCEDLRGYPSVIRSVLELSRKFDLDPVGFMSRIAVLKGLGFGEGTVRRVLERFPRVILMKEGEIYKRIEFLKRIGIGSDGVDWIVYSVPEMLGFGIENRLMPLLAEFEQLGFSKEVVRKEILAEPRFLIMEVGELTRCMELLGSLKCREPIKMKIFRNGELRAGFDVKLRIDCLCRHGLTHREAFTVLWKEPRVIAYDLEETDTRIQYLVNTMRFSSRCLVEVPEYLGVSFEKQIVPRYNVIQYLRAKGGLGDEVGLKGIVKPSRLRFYNFYVKPYPECEKLYGRFSEEVGSKRQHPSGMWKLFKSPSYSDSKEDVKNMKSFMDPSP
ncbi:Transcription termination factor MTERF15, mitochondrial [Linum grandiflorum]